MALISMRDICWGLGGAPLLDHVTFQIEKGERICLVGRNGVGKSSLMKIISGDLTQDSGEVVKQQGIQLATLPQEVPRKIQGTLFDVLAGDMGQTGRSLVEYKKIINVLNDKQDALHEEKKAALESVLDSSEAKSLTHRINGHLSKFNFDPKTEYASLSAGMKRRVLFARALVGEPDVLLLDEPTNHLDIDTICWMEGFILRHVKTLLFITHDRVFLQKIATRILELDRGQITSYTCDYATYLNRRQAALDARDKQDAVFDKKLSSEEVWIRQGIKARRTRNEGRVRVLAEMRKIRRDRQKKLGNVSLRVQEAEKTGKLVIEAQELRFDHEGVFLIDDFSTVISRGDKVGIMGPNGAGKTTLLKLLLKQIKPRSGRVRHGTGLQVAYFDQLRMQLEEDKTVRENIGEGNDFILFNGEKRHVISYLQDFLFSPDRCHTPVHILSGGEKNRLMLARLFAKPANVLVMDEPTNDLDAETLELLEDVLFGFTGTLLLVSHDRAFINNVVTGTLVFEGKGRVVEYAGGYDDWLIQGTGVKEETADREKAEKPVKEKTRQEGLRKLGYMEKRELLDLPKKIDNLEAEQKTLFDTLADPLFFKRDKASITDLKDRLARVELEIEDAYHRWEVLDAMEKEQSG